MACVKSRVEIQETQSSPSSGVYLLHTEDLDIVDCAQDITLRTTSRESRMGAESRGCRVHAGQIDGNEQRKKVRAGGLSRCTVDRIGCLIVCLFYPLCFRAYAAIPFATQRPQENLLFSGLGVIVIVRGIQ